ncbi:hypothetical protein AX17_006710 [Amanita inopinata Kibby_2008]|nr:hypothetical protein AX17_006710 [Amanita inopinata Kibby_2008]
MTHILKLPLELIERVLVHLDPIDVSRLAQTCRLAHSVVYDSGDDTLWRSLYLAQPLDDPRRCVWYNGQPKTEPIDWKAEVQRVVRAWTVVESVAHHRRHGRVGWRGMRDGEYGEVLRTLVDIVSCVTLLRERKSIEDVSESLLWAAAVLRLGFLDVDPASAFGVRLTREERQLRARLHVMFGVTRRDLRKRARVRSRAYVYDLRRYRWDNDFGPFDETGRVDWEHVRMLQHVVAMHVLGPVVEAEYQAEGEEEEEEGGEDRIGAYEYALFGMSMPYTQIVASEEEAEARGDWAGVAGLWNVSYCFCEYGDLMRYNESSVSSFFSVKHFVFKASILPGTEELDASVFESETFLEVFRTLEVELVVTHTMPDPEHPTKPVIYFAGEMRGTASTMTGRVQMTPDEQVKWSFVSGDEGNAVWSSVGVQVGGLRSSYGVLGAWTTIFHDDDDPFGPFWLRKCIE